MQYLSFPCGDSAFLQGYILEQRPDRNPDRSPRPAVVIVPGGGYHCIVQHEQECIAMQFAAHGYHSFVLHYSVNTDGEHPLMDLPLRQLAIGVRQLRSHAEDWLLDVNRIVVCGFSAGGHLAGSLAVSWHRPWLYGSLGCCPGDIRPNAVILGYPVITTGTLSHRGSIDHLLGTAPDPMWMERFSLEKQVTSSAPPCFLWHTGEDEFVPVLNSVLYAEACIRSGVPVELHLFPHNCHGLSLANAETAFNSTSADSHIAGWLPLCFEWLEQTWRFDASPT